MLITVCVCVFSLYCIQEGMNMTPLGIVEIPHKIKSLYVEIISQCELWENVYSY